MLATNYIDWLNDPCKLEGTNIVEIIKRFVILYVFANDITFLVTLFSNEAFGTIYAYK